MKKATEPSSKMPEAKRTITFIEKTILLQKHLKIRMEKRQQNRLPKCLKTKKPTLSLKKQFCSKKTDKFIWKKATEPIFQNAWGQKNKHSH